MKRISTLSLSLALSSCALAALDNANYARDLKDGSKTTVYSYPPVHIPNPTPAKLIKRRKNNKDSNEKKILSKEYNSSSSIKFKSISSKNNVTRNSFKGKATHFTPAVGACNNGRFGDSGLVVAINKEQYGSSQISEYCGKCVEVSGDLGSLVLKVVDKCMGCGYGNLDIATDAYSQITSGDGVGDITWKFVSC